MEMSIYLCDVCQQYKDADIHGCLKNPTDEDHCICEDCFNNFSDCYLEEQFEMLNSL